jgi:hypothetical protein
LRRDIRAPLDLGIDGHKIIHSVAFEPVAGIIEYGDRVLGALPDLSRKLLDIVRHLLETANPLFRDIEAKRLELFGHQLRVLPGIGETSQGPVIGVANDTWKRSQAC